MEYWTVQLSGTTRAFLTMESARDYAMEQLTINAVPPTHISGPVDVHILYTRDKIARVQPLQLAFAANPTGHIIIIPDQEEA